MRQVWTRRTWATGLLALGGGVWAASAVAGNPPGGLVTAAFETAADRPIVAVPTDTAPPAEGVPLLRLTSGTETQGMRATLDRITIVSPGESGKGALEAARAVLPLSRLTPQGRRQAEEVLSGLSMFRALPAVRMTADHDAYRFFVEHPDVAVSLWRALDVSACQMWQTGPDRFESDGGDGSVGTVDVLLRGERDHVAVGRGSFKSPLLVKPIKATVLLHLHTDYVTRADGESETVCRAYLYVAFPSQAVEAAAKVVSPVTNTVLDRNFEEIALFVHMMTLAMRNQPGWVEDLAGELDGVLERRRPELLQVTAKAYVAHRRRQLAAEGLPVTVEGVLPTGR